MIMSISLNITNSIIDHYEKKHCYYEFDEVFSTFIIPVRIEDDIAINAIEHKIKVTNYGYLIQSEPDVYVKAEKRYAILKFINMINCNLLSNSNQTFNFSFDVLTGAIRFNRCIECGDKYLSADEIDSITSFSEGNIYIFGKGFLDIIHNSVAPEIAVVSCMNELRKVLSHSDTKSEECIYTKLAGTTFDGRQGIISELKNANKLNTGHLLFLYREYDNEYDSNAVRVVHPETSKMLGYIPKDISRTLAEKIDAGIDLIAFVESVTGGNGYNLGINIKVCIDKEGLSYLGNDEDNYYGGGDFDDGIGDLNPYGLDGDDYDAWLDSFD